MGQPEILRKLSNLLSKYDPFTEESQVVYLFVEVRKYLDQMEHRGRGFALLRFYCDWIVHTSKDRHVQHIAPIMEETYTRICQHLKGGGKAGEREFAAGIVQFENLRAQITELLRVGHVGVKPIETARSWS